LDKSSQESNYSDKQKFFLYSPEIDGKLDAKKSNNIILIPEEDNFRINIEKDSFSHKNGKAEKRDNLNSIIEKPEIVLSNDYLRKELKLKLVQKTYDSEIIEWLFNVSY